MGGLNVRERMRNWLIPIITIAISVSTLFGNEVTTKNLDDVINEIPKSGGSGFITREVSKVKGFYRGKTLVLLEYNSELTLNLEGRESNVTNSTKYFVVAKGQKILRIEGDTFAISFVSSPWPIDVSHVHHVQDGKGTGRSQICVPEIDFFEQIEFEDGKLLPLMDGDEFEDFKEFKLDFLRKNLKKSEP